MRVWTMPRLDLNLVRAFVAIYEAKSVTKAADWLAVTQPALSHSLSRLRSTYSDQLFVRGQDGLIPTSRADQLFGQFNKALQAIEGTLEPMDRFDPLQSTRRFRLAMSDIGVLSFTYPLLRRFQANAPSIEIEVQKVGGQIVEDLAVGRVDAVIGNLPALAAVARSSPLFHEHYVCVMSTEHPTISEKISIEEYVSGRHIVLSTPTTGNQLVEDALMQLGVSRRVVARVPHFAGLSHLLVQSDLLAVLPSRAARLLTSEGKLKSIELPLDLPTFEVRVYWHARHESSMAHKWLVSEITATLHDPTSRS
jgi:DNA-binding transcriptional LysR family regulator